MADILIFFNTGWMDFYEGITNEAITGSGKHVAKEGWGGEMYNYKSQNGRVFSYVQPKIDKKYGNESIIKIEKIEATADDVKISGVNFEWKVRKTGTGGIFFVGWYMNATILN